MDRFMRYIDLAWYTLLFVGVIVACCMLGAAVLSNHEVQHYYIGSGYEGSVCVYAENPWDSDTVAMCSNDREQALEFARKANEILKQRQK